MSTWRNLILAKKKGGMPAEGLLVYAPLDAYSETAATGQTITYSAQDYYYTTDSGIPCLRYHNSHGLSIPMPSSAAFTGSLWLKKSGSDASNTNSQFLNFTGTHSGGTDAITLISKCDKANNCYRTQMWNNTSGTAEQSSNITAAILAPGAWMHVGIVHADNQTELYLNGTYKGAVAFASGIVASTVMVNAYTATGTYRYYAKLRIYGRALSSSEIATLATELTPA